MFQFALISEIRKKLLAKEIADDLNHHSDWLKIGSLFKIYYQSIATALSQGSTVAKTWKIGPLPGYWNRLHSARLTEWPY